MILLAINLQKYYFADWRWDGDSEITAARNYAEGAGGFFKGIDALPLTGQYTHYALNKKPANRTTSPTRLHQQPPGQLVSKPITARWASIFTKRSPNDSGNGKAAGLATGNVSTAELQDATPAALVAHVTSRKCYGPSATSEKCPGNALEKGGKDRLPNSCLTPVPMLRLAAVQNLC